MMGLVDQMRYLLSAMSRNSIYLPAKKGLLSIITLLNMQGDSNFGLTKISLAGLSSFLGMNLLLL